MFKEFDLATARGLVTQIGRPPRFGIMPVSWCKGSAFTRKMWQPPAFVRKEKMVHHIAFLFSYVPAAFWDMGEILGVSGSVDLQATTHSQVRVGLTKEAMEYFRPHMQRLTESVGLVVVDEGSG